eukprot:358113-Pyramimonas_sp.AAC.1
MSSTALPGKFNDKVECDLMLYEQQHNVFRVIDRCIRCGAGIEIPDKTMTSVLDAHHQRGTQVGPAKVILRRRGHSQ